MAVWRQAEKTVADLEAKVVSQKNHIAILQAESERTENELHQAKATARHYKTPGEQQWP